MNGLFDFISHQLPLQLQTGPFTHFLPFHRRSLITDPFHALRQEIDRLFEVSTFVQWIRLEFETKENEGNLEVTAELPGVSEGDIDISLSDGILTISGEKKSEEVKEGGTYHIIERRYGSFSFFKTPL